MNNPTAEPKTKKSRTITWKEISNWQFDNKYILTGYRPEKPDYLAVFTSLTFLHNETCNIYTHLVGTLLLPLLTPTFLHVFIKPQILNVSFMDFLAFEVYFWCAETCLVLSALYHLMQPHSHHRTILAKNGSAWHCYCNYGHDFFWRILYILL